MCDAQSAYRLGERERAGILVRNDAGGIAVRDRAAGYAAALRGGAAVSLRESHGSSASLRYEAALPVQ